ncbi:MAG TPA: AmmeMemoRadiSam system protein B [Candidatus Methanomethylophilaceae archaeon]|nr:AmmeMemoRadiSam system protein B [Candidatus Methanomethylophilaceae archaeon]
MRYPVVAGRFYEGEAEALRRQIDHCFLHPHGPGPLPKSGSRRSIVAALAPHAGYMASGPAAAHVYHAILADGLPELYVLIGPGHTGSGAPVAASDEDFLTPLGVCETDREAVSKLDGIVEVDRRAHMMEHSLEVQIPFIQTIDPSPKIVAVVMNTQDPQSAVETARSLRKASAGKDTLFIASSDLSHYVPQARAEKDDMYLVERILALDVEGIYEAIAYRHISACGFGPIVAAILASKPSSAELLKYMTSGDMIPMNDVVGYAAVAFRR